MKILLLCTVLNTNAMLRRFGTPTIPNSYNIRSFVHSISHSHSYKKNIYNPFLTGIVGKRIILKDLIIHHYNFFQTNQVQLELNGKTHDQSIYINMCIDKQEFWNLCILHRVCNMFDKIKTKEFEKIEDIGKKIKIVVEPSVLNNLHHDIAKPRKLLNNQEKQILLDWYNITPLQKKQLTECLQSLNQRTPYYREYKLRNQLEKNVQEICKPQYSSNGGILE